MKKKKEPSFFQQFTENLIYSEVRKKIGKNATLEDIQKYIASLNEEEAQQLAMDAIEGIFPNDPSVFDETVNEADFPLPFMDNDEDDQEEYESTGHMECMPATEIKKYTIRIKLRHISPSIWRKIVVPSSIKLTSLAEIILEAMGWWNEHLHQFRQKNTYYTTKIKEKDEIGWSDTRWGGDYSIAHLLQMEKDHVVFEYDYGDSWEHDVTLSKIEDYDDDETPYVRLLSGKRACPPEDCGGVQGYYDLCEAMTHPRSAHAKELKEWLGETFKPEEFDLDLAKFTVDEFNNFNDESLDNEDIDD